MRLCLLLAYYLGRGFIFWSRHILKALITFQLLSAYIRKGFLWMKILPRKKPSVN